mgnify:FL=1
MSDEEVERLINIADSVVIERRRHWDTLGFPISHHYTLDEQLSAIRSLGNSVNPIALEYLRKLATENLVGLKV